MPMKTRATISVSLLAGAIALSLITWRWARETRRSREATAEIEAKQALVRAERDRDVARLVAVERERVATKATLDALKESPATVGPAKSPARTGQRLPSILELIRDAPDAEAFYLESKRAQLAARYGPLFRTLGLSAEAVAAFEDNYIRREGAQMDLENVLGTRGEESVGAVEKLRAAAESNYNAAQRALLGDAGFGQLEAYENVAWWRGTVSAMAGVAAVEHIPFSAGQADALVEAFRSSNQGQSGIDWEHFDAQARGILSPEQFEVIHTMDPGPTRGGLLQTRLYDLVEKAKRLEPKSASPAELHSVKPAG